jgi:hypothetical protein
MLNKSMLIIRSLKILEPLGVEVQKVMWHNPTHRWKGGLS